MPHKPEDSTNHQALREAIDKLRSEHRDLKQRMEVLNRRPHLSPGEQLEAKTLQKMKLLKKDAIAALETRLSLIAGE